MRNIVKTFSYILTVLLLFIYLPSTIQAATNLEETSVNYVKKQENGKYCIDLEQAYKNSKEEGKALTQKDTGIDSKKRINTLATLLNFYTILAGNEILCIKDAEMAKTMSFAPNDGILGLIERTNSAMFENFPTVSVTNHLAQTFIPGYKENNSVMAVDKKLCQEQACKYHKVKAEDYEDCVSKCKKDFDDKYSKTGMTFSQMNEAFLEEDGQTTQYQKCNNTSIDSKISQKLDEAIRKVDIVEKIPQEEKIQEGSPVYKSGKTGYSYLKDDIKLDKMWSQFRNMAYLLYVVILIVIGFMIMFRNKIGGQLMVSISNSIPQLILGLVLITFSFAIVGLALDVGKVLMVVSEGIFEKIDPPQEIVYIGPIKNMTDTSLQKINEKTGFSSLFNKCDGIYEETNQKTGNTNGLWGQITKIGVGGIFTAMSTTTQKSKVSDATPISSMLKLLADIILQGLKFPVAIMLIYNIMILLVCVYASFKLFLTMFTTYIKIFMNVILAPLQILAGSIPGNSSALVNWFKSVFANVLVFPAIFLIINFAIYLGENIDKTEDFNFFGNSGVIWPSFIANLKGVILIGSYIFCSTIPGVINGFLKVGESKEIASAGESTKKALGKLPLIGGMFG